MRLLIKITKDVLEESKYCPGLIAGAFTPASIIQTNCAVAKAIRRLLPDARVTSDLLYPLGESDPITCIELPNEAKKFIKSFDSLNAANRVKMNPIQFEIVLPNTVIDQIGISSAYKILSESKTLELVSI